MIIREFQESDRDAILIIYQKAFAGYPWFENLSDEVVRQRWESNYNEAGFCCFVAETNKEITGAIWWDKLNLEILKRQRGTSLCEFVEQKFSGYNLIWEREVMVSPEFQGRGIAGLLRKSFLNKLESSSSLILTRMRDDNFGIIKIAERLGYARTGIRMQSSQNRDVFHEYWYFGPR